MPIGTRKVENGLKNKGFVKKNGSHKSLRYIASDGTATSILTHYSHRARGKDVKDGELGAMARQCKISARQFRDLVDCTLTVEDYEEMLRVRGYLELETEPKDSRRRQPK
jgi:predicted RNA binding protein YcfA (HicA-like mRNA interferase family)